MKECKYCGTKYEDHLLECPNCGANLVVSEKDKIIEDANKEKEIADVKEKIEAEKKMGKPKMALGKKVLITMCGIIAVLAIVIIITTIQSNRPVTADGKTNNDLEKEYNAAMESMELGNYEQAIAEFDDISTEYKNYDKVTEQRDKAVEAYREQVLNQVDSYISVGKHNDALSALMATINTYGETKELLQKKDEILYDYKQGIFAEVETYAATGDFSTAIMRLQMLLDVIGTDADTEMKMQYYQKSQVLKQVQVYENEDNYAAAIEYLQKKLEELGQDADLATKLTSMYSIYKTTCVDKARSYVKENDYKNAITVLEDLTKIIGNDDEVSMLIFDYKKEMTLKTAQTYIENKDYLSGIEYLKLQIKILGQDSSLSTKLNELTSLYKTVVIQDAEKEAKNGQYTNAVTSLKSLISAVGSDAEIEAKILEYRKAEINVKLAEFDKSKDYAGAITYLQNNVSEAKTDAELKTKLEDYISKYKKDLFTKAETVYKTDGFVAAVQLLNNDNLLKNDPDLKAKIEYYNNKKPILLSDLDCYKKEDMQYSSSAKKDFAGNQYQEYYFGEWHNNTYRIYFLDNKYERFQCNFVITIADNVAKAKDAGYDVSIVIKDDDTNEVLFNKKLDSKNIEGIKVDIDISHVKFLKIELNNSPQNYAIMVNAQLIKK